MCGHHKCIEQMRSTYIYECVCLERSFLIVCMKRSIQLCSSSKLQTVFPKEEGKEEQVKKQPRHHLWLWYGQFLKTLAYQRCSRYFSKVKSQFSKFCVTILICILNYIYRVVNAGHTP